MVQPPGSILDPTFFNINDLNDGAEPTLGKIIGDKRPGRLAGNQRVALPYRGTSTGWWEPHEVQQRKMQSPSPEEEPCTRECMSQEQQEN